MNTLIQSLESKGRALKKGKVSFRYFIYKYFNVNPFEFDNMTDTKFAKMLVKEYEIYIESEDY